jgi:hypothetical protein
MTTLPGIIFAASHPLFMTRGVNLMEYFTEKHGGFGSNRLIQKQMGSEFPRNDTYKAPAAIDSEEIERVESQLDTTGFLLKAKKENARPSNRRRKTRVYLP